VAAAVLLAAALPAASADPLRMENALPVAPVRLGGPAFVAGELQSDFPGLLEGRLRFVVRDGSTVLSVVETDSLALVQGITPFRQIIPLPAGPTSYSLPEAAVEFWNDDGSRYRLGTIALRIPQGTWEAVALFAEPKVRGGVSGADATFRDALNLEKAFTNDPQTASSIDCYLPSLPASHFPEQPLAYCTFDLVGLSAESFQRLSGRQFDAIAAWVRAGGSACVVADGPLDTKHAEFLNALFRDSHGGPFLRDDTGRIVEPEGTASGVFARRAGLGFAAVLFGPAEQFDFESRAWRSAHARLWKLREDRVDRPAVVTGPPPNGQIIGIGQDGQPMYLQGPEAALWNVPTPSFGTAVVNALKPNSIRLMPGWAIVLLLFGYVAIVGPADYFLLGKARLRKWTWVVFPAVTFAVTWGVVATADAFMSDNDHRRTIDIVDFDVKGEPVRRTRLEMLFRGSGDPVLHELSRAYFSSVDRQHFDNEENSAPTGPYAGTLPSRYVVPQQVAKWTPQVNRTFEIEPQDVMAVDWAKAESTSAGLLSLPGGATGHVFRTRQGQLGGGAGLGYVNDRQQYSYVPNMNMTGFQNPQVGGAPFLQAATLLSRSERGSLQFQRSPIGFGRLDDLPFIDDADPAADALVIWAQEVDGDLVVYRNLTSKEVDRVKRPSPAASSDPDPNRPTPTP